MHWHPLCTRVTIEHLNTCQQDRERPHSLDTSLKIRPLLSSFSAFRHHNFRLYFIGLLISIIGLWAQNVAQAWLVYDLTDSPLVLGWVTFVMAIPVWILGPWAGVVIDRVPRRSLLIITQTVQMVQAFILAWLTFSGQIEVWHVTVLSALRGVVNAFDAPARQAIIIELVGKEDLSNGIALNSTMFSLARTLGPALGGLVVAYLGTAWAFTINGITFLAIILSLVLLRLDKPLLQSAEQSFLHDLTEGLRFIWNSKPVVALIMVALAVALFGSNFTTLMPVFARDVLGKSEVEFGMLNGAVGLGSILGALLVSYLSTRPGRGHHLSLMTLLFPITLIAFALSQVYELSLVFLLAVGGSFIPQLSFCNMLIQSNIPDALRGRVMSVYSLVIFGAFPLGALLAGQIADVLGASIAIVFSAGAVALIGLVVRITVPQLAKLE